MAQERKEKRSILGILDCIEDIVGGSMFFIMIMLLAFNVFSWWFAHRRIGQLEEGVTACLVWVSYINMGSHYRKKEHVRVDFLLTKLSPRNQKLMDIINDVCSFAIGVVVLYFGWILMWKSRNKFTGVLKICYFWIDLGLVLGFSSLLFNIIYKYLPHKERHVEAEK